MKVLVIDNEQNIRESVVALIQAFCPMVTEVKESDGVKNGLDTLAQFSPDVLFLDVELGDGMGMDILSALGNIPFQVIFITAHNKYAIDAFRYSAIDFLLKPVDPEALLTAMEKAQQNIKNKNLTVQLEVFKEYFKSTTSPNKKIVLKDNDNIYFVNLNEIEHCEADSSYTRFFLITGERILISKIIKEYDEMLEPLGFLRTHQSHLVNISMIKRYDKNNECLVMDSGTTIPVSQRKKETVLNLLKNQ